MALQIWIWEQNSWGLVLAFYSIYWKNLCCNTFVQTMFFPWTTRPRWVHNITRWHSLKCISSGTQTGTEAVIIMGRLQRLLPYREEWLTDKQGLANPIYLVTSAFSQVLHFLFDLLFPSENNCSKARYVAHGSFTHSASECLYSDSLLNVHEWQIVQTTGSQHPQHTGVLQGVLLARIAAGNRCTLDTRGVTKDSRATSWDLADECTSFKFTQDLALHFFLLAIHVLVVQLWLFWVHRWWDAGKMACIGKRIWVRSDRGTAANTDFLQLSGKRQPHLDQKDQVLETFSALHYEAEFSLSP